MKNSFREWFPPSAEEERELWGSALIVLDSNVLLGFYRYPPDVLEEFIRVLQHLGDQLWMPHQVGQEFLRNREDRVPEQRRVLDRLLRDIDGVASALDRIAIPEYHPVLDRAATEAVRAQVQTAIESLTEQVEQALEKTPVVEPEELLANDPVLENITGLYEGRVSPPFGELDLRRLFDEGRKRYERGVPPGFKDAEKEEPRRYNDLLVWKQILVRAKSEEPHRACIFVTNDRKEDWWRRRAEAMLGPRTELVAEFLDEVGQRFVMYTPEDFLEHAREFRLGDVSRSAIDAVREVSETPGVTVRLRQRRMHLPPAGAREGILGRIYDALESGEIDVVGRLSNRIRELGPNVANNPYIVTPLFFSLINESYGPVRSATDQGLRLRARGIESFVSPRHEFVQQGQIAWLAQALYRLEGESFSEDELLAAFFGSDAPDDALRQLRLAQDAASRDLSYRRPLDD